MRARILNASTTWLLGIPISRGPGRLSPMITFNWLIAELLPECSASNVKCYAWCTNKPKPLSEGCLVWSLWQGREAECFIELLAEKIAIKCSVPVRSIELWSGVGSFPASTLTLRWANLHDFATISRSRLCRNTASPPCLHVEAWWSKGSSTVSGHKEHRDPPDVSRPSHHLMATWNWSGFRWRPRPSDGTTDNHDDAWGDEMDKRRALSAKDDELKSRLNWKSSILADKVFCIGGLSARLSTDTTFDGAT